MSRHPNAAVRRSPFPPASGVLKEDQEGRSRTTKTPLRIKVFGLDLKAATKNYLREHAGLKLGKFALHIQSLTVRLKDESGPHGEPLVACSIMIALEDGGMVVVERSAQDSGAAFNSALDVAERSVRSVIRRSRDLRRYGNPLEVEA